MAVHRGKTPAGKNPNSKKVGYKKVSKFDSTDFLDKKVYKDGNVKSGANKGKKWVTVKGRHMLVDK